MDPESPVPVEPVRPAARSTPRRTPILAVAGLLVAVLAGGGLFLSGYLLGRSGVIEPGTPSTAIEAFIPFWDTYHAVTQRYAGGEVDQEAVIQGAIKGMIDALGDPFSQYLTADQYRLSLQSVGGQFEGIGAEISTRAADGTPGCATLGPACRLMVISPIDGSPAQRAGLSSGDLVLATDGTSLDGLTLDGARGRIRGPRGSAVVLTVQRGDGPPFQVTITRDIVQSQEVVSRDLADGRVGYIRLTGFSDTGAARFTAALAAHLKTGQTAIVLDLRGNPGGYVTAARTVASQFIASGPIFWEQDATGDPVATAAIPGGLATSSAIKVVCLIDSGSASASEIVAGALQDTGRATLVGGQSYGKGTVQQWQELTGGGAFKLTIARWSTPDRRSINKVGLTPDIVVSPPSDTPAGEDPVLDRAVELLGGGAGTGWLEAA